MTPSDKKLEPAEQQDSIPENTPEAPAEKPETPAQATGGSAITSQNKRLIMYVALAVAVGLMTAWFFASMFPNYLLYATPAIEADAVVLFLGPGEEARQKQVDELVAGGMTKFVIVPWEGRIYAADTPDKPIETEKGAEIADGIKADALRFYVERTHIEMLQARALMDHIVATSANFVSSPYHMRRIKIMAGKVFDAKKYNIAFVPTAYEPRYVPWFANGADVKWVFSEWGKIGWYFLYSPFFQTD